MRSTIADAARSVTRICCCPRCRAVRAPARRPIRSEGAFIRISRTSCQVDGSSAHAAARDGADQFDAPVAYNRVPSHDTCTSLQVSAPRAAAADPTAVPIVESN